METAWWTIELEKQIVLSNIPQKDILCNVLTEKDRHVLKNKYSTKPAVYSIHSSSEQGE